MTRTTLSRVLPMAAVGLLGCSDSAGPGAPDFEDPTAYLTYDEIVDHMRSAESRAPAIAELVDVTAMYGTPLTHEGRAMYALRISDNVGVDEDEPTFLMVAAHHANEIGTPVVALDAIGRFLRGYGSDQTITSLVDEYEIWIAPLWNPDSHPDSRKNGRTPNGVNLNRNYPFLWDTACSGSTDPTHGNFKGAAPGSEPEVQAMVALSDDQRFTKVLDYHSAGRETLFGYSCSPHELLGYLGVEAAGLSIASGYEGRIRPPSAEGEHYQWQLGLYSNYSFLTEIGVSQSPTYEEAVAETEGLWAGTLGMRQRPVPISGHVTDAVSGDALEVSIEYLEHPFTLGERNVSEPRFGRYHAFLPTGAHTLRFSHPGYVTLDVPIMVTSAGVVRDIALQRTPLGN